MNEPEIGSMISSCSGLRSGRTTPSDSTALASGASTIASEWSIADAELALMLRVIVGAGVSTCAPQM
jgi:hypothetical protein